MLAKTLSCCLYFYCLIISRAVWNLVSLWRTAAVKVHHILHDDIESECLLTKQCPEGGHKTLIFFCPFGVNEQIVLLCDVNLIWENRLFKTSCHCLYCCKHKCLIFSECKFQEPWFVCLKLCRICNKVHKQLFCTSSHARGTEKNIKMYCPNPKFGQWLSLRSWIKI